MGGEDWNFRNVGRWAIFLAGESTISINDFFAVFAYVTGIPGLIISWFAAFMYIPLAAEALKEIREKK